MPGERRAMRRPPGLGLWLESRIAHRSLGERRVPSSDDGLSTRGQHHGKAIQAVARFARIRSGATSVRRSRGAHEAVQVQHGGAAAVAVDNNGQGDPVLHKTGYLL